MMLITQDDRLTAGAWATCEFRDSNARKLCVSNHNGLIKFTQYKEDGEKFYSSTMQII